MGICKVGGCGVWLWVFVRWVGVVYGCGWEGWLWQPTHLVA